MSQPMLHAHPSAVIVITVHHDTITQCARLVLGESHTVSRTWKRIGRGLWQSHEPEFLEAEERIGPELAEYLDGLDLPTDVADLLPPPIGASVEVGHG
ncbi:MAG: hypothetical protein KatS3mg127_1233 [Silanimonas sp.]|nr:MAG: hypothetical protein KatS3mg127_1233 [Silanimonas sp.]